MDKLSPSVNLPGQQELRLNFAGNLPKIDSTPSQIVSATKAEVALIPGIENPRTEAVAGLLGATLLLAAGGAVLYNRNRRQANQSSAPRRDPYSADTAYTAKRVAANGSATSIYADPQAFIGPKGKFGGTHLKVRGPDVMGGIGADGLPREQYGTRARDTMHYPDPNLRAIHAGEDERISRRHGGLGENRSVRSINKRNKARKIEREKIIPNIARYGEILYSLEDQETYIAQTPGLSRNDIKHIRKGGRQVRAAGARIGSLEYRARGWRNR